MLLVDGAAEPFDAVVRAVVDLDIVDGRAGADARQSDAVQLIARRNLEARIADLHVADAAAIVVGRGAAEKGVARSDFDRTLTADAADGDIADAVADRSEERRVGKECWSTCRSRGARVH